MVTQVHFFGEIHALMSRFTCTCPSPVVFTIYSYNFRVMGRGWTLSMVPHPRCNHCHGSGRVSGRDSQGNHESKSCHQCHGNGHRRCHVCDGTGKDFKQCQFFTIKTKYYN